MSIIKIFYMARPLLLGDYPPITIAFFVNTILLGLDYNKNIKNISWETYQEKRERNGVKNGLLVLFISLGIYLVPQWLSGKLILTVLIIIIMVISSAVLAPIACAAGITSIRLMCYLREKFKSRL